MWRLWGVVLLAALKGTKGLQFLAVTNKGLGLYNITSGQRVAMMAETELKEVDYHWSRGEVYGLTKRQILRCPLAQTSSLIYRPVVFSEDEYNFMSLAVDWVHDHLYWAAGATFMIHKANIDGSGHRIIFRGYYIETYHRTLLVDPHAGVLIWATSNQIYRMDLDGQNLEEIKFPEVLGSPRSRVKNIALDVTTRRLYFLAGFEDDDVWLLMSGNYDGSGFRRHEAVPRFTYAIAAMGDDVYWISKENSDPSSWGKRRPPQFIWLFKSSVLVPGASQKVTKLDADGIWNVKICDPLFQKLSSEEPQTPKGHAQVQASGI